MVSLSDGDFYGLDEELLKRLGELLRVARERDELCHYGRIRGLRSPTAKLIYEFLRSHQPQTLLSIRHVLGVKRNTAPVAMRELLEKGFVVVDEEFFARAIEVGSVYNNMRESSLMPLSLYRCLRGILIQKSVLNL